MTAGDVVECLDDDQQELGVTKGHVYKIKFLSPGGERIFLEEIGGWLNTDRFRRVDQDQTNESHTNGRLPG